MTQATLIAVRVRVSVRVTCLQQGHGAGHAARRAAYEGGAVLERHLGPSAAPLDALHGGTLACVARKHTQMSADPDRKYSNAEFRIICVA